MDYKPVENIHDVPLMIDTSFSCSYRSSLEGSHIMSMIHLYKAWDPIEEGHAPQQLGYTMS